MLPLEKQGLDLTIRKVTNQSKKKIGMKQPTLKGNKANAFVTESTSVNWPTIANEMQHTENDSTKLDDIQDDACGMMPLHSRIKTIAVIFPSYIKGCNAT